MNRPARHILAAAALIVLGAGITHVVSADAAPPSGWTCYVMDRMPDAADASEWRWAQRYAEGLNAVAAHAPEGTILSTTAPVAAGGAAMICVK